MFNRVKAIVWCIVLFDTMDSPILLLLLIIPCFCQRPFYAGLQPIGYPEVNTIEPQRSSNIGLPPQLEGQKLYAENLDRLPVKNQPIWYINRKHYANLQNNLQTYNQRPSGYNPFTRNTY